MADNSSVAEIAGSLNLTERRIMQLVREGMPKLARGRYDRVACLEWYVRYLQQAVEKRSYAGEDGEVMNWEVEKARLTRAQANMAELEYRKKTGELIPAAMVDDKFVTFASMVRDRFTAMPSKMAARLEHEPRETIKLKLYEAVRDVLNGLSITPLGDPDEYAARTKRGKKRAAIKGRRTRRKGNRSPA